MAKVNSIFSVRGHIGNVVFRKRNGKVFASQRPESNKQRVATDARYARVRENNAEFGAVAMVAKSLHGMTSMVDASAHTVSRAQLMKVLFPLRKLDTTHDKGKRSVQLTLKPRALKGMEWSKENALKSMLHGNVTATCSESSVTYSVPALNPETDLVAPQGATHYRLAYVVSAVSDVTWNESAGGYVCTNEEANGVRMVALGELQNLTTATEATTKVVNLGVAATDCTIVANVALLFYQRVNNNDKLLKDTNAMMTVDAWAYDGM